MEKPNLVITDASRDGFSHTLLQKKDWKLEDAEGGWVFIEVGSAALKLAWKN